MNKSIFLLSAAALLAYSTWAAGADVKPAELKKKLQAALPEITVESIKPSPVPGIYEGAVGTRIVYFTADGKYLLAGNLIEVGSRRNLTQASRAALLNRMLDGVGEANMIVMGPSKPRRTVSVFTDVDCPYCAKLHLEVPALIQGGVKVRYLFYPRGGPDSETYRRSVAVWCAQDRVQAVGVAKAGGKLDMKTCDNPVARHYELGQEFGVEGTPTIVVDDGEILPGYVPAAQLLGRLGLNGAPGAGGGP